MNYCQNMIGGIDFVMEWMERGKCLCCLFTRIYIMTNNPRPLESFYTTLNHSIYLIYAYYQMLKILLLLLESYSKILSFKVKKIGFCCFRCAFLLSVVLEGSQQDISEWKYFDRLTIGSRKHKNIKEMKNEGLKKRDEIILKGRDK